MSYLLDTDILSNTLKKQPSPELLRRMAEVPRTDQFTSAITVGEMLYGAYRSNRSEALLARLNSDYWPSIQILPFDHDAAEAYARIRITLERQGTPLAEPDMRIAATAVSRGLVLVTGNIRHFGRIAVLTVENWL